VLLQKWGKFRNGGGTQQLAILNQGEDQCSHKYFQRLTDDIGHPKLREHLASVITLMRASSNWRNFYSMLNRSLPRWDTTLPMPMPMPIDYENDKEIDS
jgi:hypothetical protein